MNKLILIGNVGSEPDIRQLQNGTVASFTLATTDKGFTKKDGTVVPDRTEWHNIVCFSDGLIKVIQSYVHKGTKLMVEGPIHTRKWQDKNGQDRYTTECHITNMEFCGSPQQKQEQPQQQTQVQQSADSDTLPF